MESTEYYKQLAAYIKEHDLDKANRVIMQELANIFVKKREDFVYMLTNAGLDANMNMTDGQLIDLFLDNVHSNKKLLLGTAFLIAHNNKVVSFDGDDEISESGMKATHKVLYNYFDADKYDNFDSESYSNAVDPVSAIATALGQGAKLGTAITEKKALGEKQQIAQTELMGKKAEAKQQLVQSILAQRQAEQAGKLAKQEAISKNKKIALIIGGSLLGLAVIGFIIYKVKKGK